MLDDDSLMNEATPLVFHLSQNHPNPFREKTVIKYCVAYTTRVRLTVLNSAGEVLDALVDEQKSPGTYEIEFDAFASQSGPLQDLDSGTYFYRLEAGDYSSRKKMELRK